MKKLSVADIGTPEQYRQLRPAMRRAMIDHKKKRRLALGPNATLHFEDYLTMKYQVQEMMRAENLRTSDAIAQELSAYNPLIPDGSNLSCTLMLEYADEQQRRIALRELTGIEQQISLQVEGHPPVPAKTDSEPAGATPPDKTSAVHFLRFEFTPGMIAAARQGARWSVRCDHPAYTFSVNPVPDHIASALTCDFDSGTLS